MQVRFWLCPTGWHRVSNSDWRLLAPFARYLAEDLYENCLFVQSGVLATDSRLNNITGTRIEMPFFDILTPRKRW